MSEMGYFSVVNFDRFQHYKDRNPPWIKLYNELLDDYEFGRLQDASKMHLIAIWLLASRTGNKIPYDAEWIKGRINATDDVDLNGLKCAGFIELDEACSKMLAERLQDARPETEGEGEGETEERRETPSESCANRNLRDPYSKPPGFHEWWSAYPRKRSKGDAHKAYAKIVKDDLATEANLLMGARAAADYWQAMGTEDEHIPYPGTWLRARGWEDDTTVRRKPTMNDMREEFINGDKRDDLGRGAIDGECMEVPEPGLEGDGRNLPPGPEGFGGRAGNGSGHGPVVELAPEHAPEAGGHPDTGQRVRDLIAKAATAAKAGTKP